MYKNIKQVLFEKKELPSNVRQRGGLRYAHPEDDARFPGLFWGRLSKTENKKKHTHYVRGLDERQMLKFFVQKAGYSPVKAYKTIAEMTSKLDQKGRREQQAQKTRLGHHDEYIEFIESQLKSPFAKGPIKDRYMQALENHKRNRDRMSGIIKGESKEPMKQEEKESPKPVKEDVVKGPDYMEVDYFSKIVDPLPIYRGSQSMITEQYIEKVVEELAAVFNEDEMVDILAGTFEDHDLRLHKWAKMGNLREQRLVNCKVALNEREFESTAPTFKGNKDKIRGFLQNVANREKKSGTSKAALSNIQQSASTRAANRISSRLQGGATNRTAMWHNMFGYKAPNKISMLGRGTERGFASRGVKRAGQALAQKVTNTGQSIKSGIAGVTQGVASGVQRKQRQFTAAKKAFMRAEDVEQFDLKKKEINEKWLRKLFGGGNSEPAKPRSLKRYSSNPRVSFASRSVHLADLRKPAPKEASKGSVASAPAAKISNPRPDFSGGPKRKGPLGWFSKDPKEVARLKRVQAYHNEMQVNPPQKKSSHVDTSGLEREAEGLRHYHQSRNKAAAQPPEFQRVGRTIEREGVRRQANRSQIAAQGFKSYRSKQNESYDQKIYDELIQDGFSEIDALNIAVISDRLRTGK